MILKKEILSKAEEWKVPGNTIDKDYVLGHFLNSFYSFGNNPGLFVFKGGTCLRKCYFPDYRFSEDLDFTLLDKSFLIDKSFFEKIAKLCENDTGIGFDVRTVEKKRFKDDEKGYKCILFFWGANHNKNEAPAPKERWTSKIENDISFEEEILFPIQQKEIIHLYSDKKIFTNNKIPVYSLEEVLTEKIRAFYQRSYKAPRDFYDVWYLLNNVEFVNWDNLNSKLLQKCAIKNKKIDKAIFNNKEVIDNVSKQWKNSIAHHLPEHNPVEFNEVWSYLKTNLFNKFLQIT